MFVDSDASRERLRVEALSRYFASNDITADIVGAQRGEPRPPSLSSSSVLTALTQNGALRFDCDRAFVSLMDASTQYIIAEATRSISLRNPHRSANPQDDLFLGIQALDKNYGICPQSIAIFTESAGCMDVKTHNVVANSTRYIIRDLRTMDKYCNCSYVRGFPFMVSYAEVPVKSASGQIIGTYCVMDNKVRDDFFSEETITVLTEIAASITEHLELQVVKQERDRGVQMMKGLSRFIEGEKPQSAETTFLEKENFNRVPEHVRDGYFASKNDQETTLVEPPSSDSSQSGHASPGSSPSSSDTPLTTPSEMEALEIAFPLRPLSTQTSSDRLTEVTIEPDNNHVPVRRSRDDFARGASLIRKAIDIEGLVFLDSSVSSEPDSPGSEAICAILGSSVVPKSCNLGCPESPLSLHQTSLDHLIREFPRGCVLAADDRHVYVFSEGDAPTSRASPRQLLDTTTQSFEEFRSLVQKARSLIFLPLWDSTRDRFYVGMLGWSSDPTRVFAEQDLTCLSAFGKTFMTDLARSEMTELALAKSDFLSSISHELRSPLHGVLAAAEFLQDTEHDQNQADLIGMVQSCASTLLDTLNHLLDFSKVSKLSDAKTHARNNSISKRLDARHNVFGEEVKDYLCRLVQDVVEGVHFGQASQQAAYRKNQTTPVDKFVGADTPLDPALFIDSVSDAKGLAAIEAADVVAVFLNMESRAEWCMTLCAGAWKRLVMNLFANALKYTHRGFVEVSLKMIVNPMDPRKRCAHLMVKDTGIGMSQEYMDHHLYQPFVQANTLVNGTGLGLSIVKQIVDDLDGTINVESTVGVGTRFDVYIPLPDQDTATTNKLPSGGQILDSTAFLNGRTLALLSPSYSQLSRDSPLARAATEQDRTSAMHSCVKSIAERWFGMKVVIVQSPAEVDADILLVEATHAVDPVRMNAETRDQINKQRTILVGPTPSTNFGQIGLRNDIMKLDYPLGPKSLSRALFAALNSTMNPDFSPLTDLSATKDEGLILVADTSLSNPQPEVMPIEPKNESTEDKSEHEQTEPHLLLVDDNAINLKLLSTYVKKLGFSAELAVDGRDAFEKYQASTKRRKVTTILMDISMPIMNGFESARAIREFEAKSSGIRPAKIIALTGLGSEASKREAELSGIDDFRTKPVAMKTLKEILNAPG